MDINYEEEDIHLSPPMKFFDPAFLANLIVRVRVFVIILGDHH
jgi:hypothetical protein